MKSGKQKRAELTAKRAARAAREATAVKAARAAAVAARRAEWARVGVPVNRAALAPHTSYGEPVYVVRGFYLDAPFTTARRCRACRREERERKAAVRRTHPDGLARKRGSPPG